MTAEQLIEALQKVDPECEVYAGYESDDPLSSVSISDVLELKSYFKTVINGVFLRIGG